MAARGCGSTWSWRLTKPLRLPRSAARAGTDEHGHRRHPGAQRRRRCSAETLDAVRAQRVDAERGAAGGRLGLHRRLARALAEAAGAAVIDVPRGEFSHGGTRNLLVRAAARRPRGLPDPGRHPGRRRAGWRGCSRASRWPTTWGWCSAPTGRARTPARWCGASWTSGSPRSPPTGAAGGPPRRRRPATARPFFTDANGCVARRGLGAGAVPARSSYAEDQMLARDMLAAGWAKAYHPAAAVVALARIPAAAAAAALVRRGPRAARGAGPPRPRRARCAWRAGGPAPACATTWPWRARGRRAGAALLPRSLAHHAARALGATLGSRADRLPGPRAPAAVPGGPRRLRPPMLNRLLNDLPRARARSPCRPTAG